MYISTREMVISIICNACGVLGLILWAIEAHKSNAIQYIQRIESVESVGNNDDIIVRSNLEPFRVKPKDEPQTCDTCRFDNRYGIESICTECSRHYSDCYAPKDEQSDIDWKDQMWAEAVEQSGKE